MRLFTKPVVAKSALRRGFFSIAGGTVAGQIIALLCAPLLSRLYSPSDFGTFAVISAIAVTVGTVAALRLELAVPLPERESDAHALAAAGFGFALIVFLFTTAGVATFGDRLVDSFRQPDLMPWLWAVPITSLLMTGCLVLNQLAIRNSQYKIIGRRNLLQSMSILTTQLVAGSAGLKPGGLVLGMGLGNLVGMVSLIPSAGLLSNDAKVGRTWTTVLAAVSRYRRFPLLLAPAGLLNVLGLQLPVILIAYWYGGAVAGWLALTQRVLGLPVTLIGTAIAQVYLSELARAVRGNIGRAQELFARGTFVLIIVAALLAASLLAFGPWLFAVVFGPEWHESGQYARALSVGLAAQLIASPLSQTLVVLERAGLQLMWDTLRVCVTVATVAAAVGFGASPLATMWLLGASTAVLYGLSWYWSFSALKRRGRCAIAASQAK